MKKTLIIIGVIAVVIIGALLVTFSFLNKEKTSITADAFRDTMEEKGYELTDSTSLFVQYGSIVTKSFVAKKNGYQIEFYQLSDAENAISMYNTNKAKFESQKTNSSTSTTANMNNYNTYSLTTNEKYKYVSRIDNTLVYLDVSETYKDEVKDVMKEIGY